MPPFFLTKCRVLASSILSDAMVQEAKIEALYNDGILMIKLPKMEQAMRSKIAIK